jgi:succinyl-CoA synthetase beta subunit
VRLERLRFRSTGEPRPGEKAEFCRRFGLPADATEKLGELIARLHRAFVELDAALIEINPLALTETGEWLALDAKLAIDDNAMFRHPDLGESGRDAETDSVERHAQQHQINFVQMGGNIGAVVNGAGLGLATLDMICAAGGTPANFMDIRTTAKSLDIAQGVNLVLDNPRTKVLLVNVFGGGMQPCDTIIEGVGIAYRRRRRMLPIILRRQQRGLGTASARQFQAAEHGMSGHVAGRDPRRRNRSGVSVMPILIGRSTRLLCQGMTGWAGTYHTNRMIQYGTKVVAGVTPGKGGKPHLDVPILVARRAA